MTEKFIFIFEMLGVIAAADLRTKITGTLNISTAAALLAAGAGARVAKHGNRSFTSRSGSADVLEALGLPIDRPIAVMLRSLDGAGIVFMFAPLMHPAMRHVGPVRRELAIPTVMNVVGPLATSLANRVLQPLLNELDPSFAGISETMEDKSLLLD